MNNNELADKARKQLYEKPFYVHNVSKILNQLHSEEISFSYMVEELNRIAKEFTQKIWIMNKSVYICV